LCVSNLEFVRPILQDAPSAPEDKGPTRGRFHGRPLPHPRCFPLSYLL